MSKQAAYMVVGLCLVFVSFVPFLGLLCGPGIGVFVAGVIDAIYAD